MGYSCTLYINSSAPDYLDKELTGDATVTCSFKQPVDVENPTVFISATSAYDDYNYMYIPEFGRYYFAKAITGNGQTITFQCHSDPLMSFKDQIRACPAVISRNPWHWDLYLPDPKLPVEARTVSGILKFQDSNFLNPDFFNGSDNCYVLTTLGGT